MKYWLIWTMVFVIAGGCATNRAPGLTSYRSLPDSYSSSVQPQPVSISRSIPRNAIVVQEIEADYCHRRLNGHAEAKDAVMTTLQANARSLGADGIAYLEVSSQSATAFLDECWNQVTATGLAYKFQ